MDNEINKASVQALPPAPAEGRLSWWIIPGRNACATIGWTIAGVTALVLISKAISAVGAAAGLPSACWQLTGARAAASTAVLGTLVSFRCGNLALFGVLYGLWLLVGHTSAMLFGSAALAGVAAWMIGMAVADRGTIVRLLTTTLAFNVLLTASGFLKAISNDPASRTTLGGWAGGVGMRALATVAVVGVIALIAAKRSAADERR